MRSRVRAPSPAPLGGALQSTQSIKCLVPRIERYLKRRGVFDYSILTPGAKVSHLKPDVVFLGDAPFHFTQEQIWKVRSKYRLWVLSRAYKNLLTGWFKLPDEAVHHIDRYELFSARDAAWKLQQAGTLVYAGREASGKNTKLLLHVLSRLQEQDVRQAKKIIFCGDLPRTAKEAKSLKWKHPPVFLGDLKSRWINIRASRPAFISLSTYLFDDFSVAAAEAQQQGWPVIIPGWNGFLDIQGSEVYRLRSDWIQNCFSEDAVANHTAFDHLYRKVRGLLDEKAADCVALKQLGEGKKFCPEWISGRDIRKKIEQLDIKSRVQLAVSFGPPVFSKPQSFRRIEELLGGGEDRF